MRTIKQTLLIWGVVVLLLVATSPAAAQPAVAGAGQLELNLVLDKETYLAGEPVVGYVQLVNRGNRVVEVLPRLAADLGTVAYRIVDAEGRARSFETFGLFEPAATKHRLAPGAALYGIELLSFGPHGWTFPGPGRYTVRVFHQSGAESRSRTLTVSTGTSPRAQADGAAVLESSQVGKFFTFEEGDHLRAALDVLNGLDADRSTIGAYANYMVGSSLSKGFADYAAKAFRPARPRQAARRLASADRGLPSFYFEAKRLLLLELNLGRLGETAAAGRAASRLKKLGRESELAAWLPTIRAHVRAMYGGEDG